MTDKCDLQVAGSRFDDIFFIDCPTVSEKKEILAIMNKRYQTKIPIDIVESLPYHTGAEIEKIVRASVYDGLDQAIANTHCT